jgi:hypothetical protein
MFQEAWGEHREGPPPATASPTSRPQVQSRSTVTGGRRNTVRMGLVLYLGGMGSRKTIFYVGLAHRFGREIADDVQAKFQAGDGEGAFKALPDDGQLR